MCLVVCSGSLDARVLMIVINSIISESAMLVLKSDECSV